MGDSDLRLAEMWPHPPEAQAEIHDKHGRLWVVHQQLIDAGYSMLEDFGIVRINERFYELQGHTEASYRIIGEHHPGGIWWIELFDDTLPEDLLENAGQPWLRTHDGYDVGDPEWESRRKDAEEA